MKHVRIYRRGDRGFHGYGRDMFDTYGAKVRVYESSASPGPRVWLNIEGGSANTPHGQEPQSAAAHLDKAQAEALIARLQTWIDEIPTRWRK